MNHSVAVGSTLPRGPVGAGVAAAGATAGAIAPALVDAATSGAGLGLGAGGVEQETISDNPRRARFTFTSLPRGNHIGPPRFPLNSLIL